MSKDTLMIHNVETDEIIIRELTDEEQAVRDAEVAAVLAEKQAQIEAAETKAVARQALLDKLGITEEEAKLLLL
jgi:hypothetical protein